MFLDDEIEFDDQPAVPTPGGVDYSPPGELTDDILAAVYCPEWNLDGQEARVPRRTPQTKIPCHTSIFPGEAPARVPGCVSDEHTPVCEAAGTCEATAGPAQLDEPVRVEHQHPLPEPSPELQARVVELEQATAYQHCQIGALEGDAYIHRGWQPSCWLVGLGFLVVAYVTPMILMVILALVATAMGFQ